ncbi:MFS transporter [Nonomuraea sp. NPDC004702]
MDHAPPQNEAPAEPLRSPVGSVNFRRFWAGQTMSQIGGRIGEFGIPVVAVQLLVATSGQLGVLTAAESLGFLLLGLPAGALVDRWSKRRTMMVSALVRAVSIALIPVAWLTGTLSIWVLYVVATVVGVCTVFFNVAYQSYVPVLVPDHEISKANARLETTAQVATSLGPSLAGLLTRFVSVPVVLFADACSYLVSLLALALTRDAEPERGSREPSGARRRLLSEIGEGLAFVRTQPVIRRLVVSMVFSGMFAAVVATLIPLLVLRNLGMDAFVLGIVMTAGSVGGVAGAAVTPLLRRRVDGGRLIVAGLLSASLFCLLAPVAAMVAADAPGLGLALVIVSEFGLMASALVFNITQVSLRQVLSPRHLLGRMNATVRFFVWGTLPIGGLLAGWLGARFGIAAAMGIGAVASFLTVLPVAGIRKIIPAGLTW